MTVANARAWPRARQKVAQYRWLWPEVIVPFAITRCALLLVGWFAQFFPRNAAYPIKQAVARGWHFSPYRLVDIWGRWDTGWYLDIAAHGYALNGAPQTTQSNIAFFPLYPFLVRCLAYLIPARLRTPGATLLAGALLSNLLLLAALALLYALVVALFADTAVARRAVFYLLIFPTSFFFSCMYTESIFLFLSVAAFYAAQRRLFWLAAVLGALLALARPPGVLIAVPLAWLYFESLGWRVRKVGWGLAALALIPASLLGFLASLYPLTGNFFAPIQVQGAWGRGFAMPWQTLLHPVGVVAFITPLDWLATVGFLLLALIALRRLPSLAYGLFALLLMLPPLLSGTLVSSARFCAVLFPLFIVMALLARRRALDQLLTVAFLVLQALLMAAWSQLYWIG
ncbi:MAG TPA: mannosyltransferase family protein [Kouleothrix sp.]|uniref:mannosyltransferase family protein n=1 Tax=Kouleothrix sp. TaxID=2779161 RepID=UPI002CB91220|nr:mannosyltransferase family protein [Kouleothrix sp.]